MDTGESQRSADRWPWGDACGRGAPPEAPPEAAPALRFESSGEEGASSEPEVGVCVALVEV